MFSIITMASSTTKPLAIVSDMRERLSSENPNRYIPASVPTSDSGTERLGMMRRRQIAEKHEDHQDDQHDSEPEIELHVGYRGADRGGLIGQRSSRRRAAGSVCSSFGSTAFTASTTAMTLVPGWR